MAKITLYLNDADQEIYKLVKEIKGNPSAILAAGLKEHLAKHQKAQGDFDTVRIREGRYDAVEGIDDFKAYKFIGRLVVQASEKYDPSTQADHKMEVEQYLYVTPSENFLLFEKIHYATDAELARHRVFYKGKPINFRGLLPTIAKVLGEEDDAVELLQI